MDFWYAFEVAQEMGIPYILNVHDDLHYNIGKRPYYEEAVERLRIVWREAQHRFVISRAMGTSYDQRFGERAWDIVTDGLTQEAIANEPARRSDRRTFYFMGAMHLTYHRNVQAFVRALETLPQNDYSFIVRGSNCPTTSAEVVIEERPFADQKAVHDDLDQVDALYFPLPFGEENASFVRYSLSTKLVSYLGSGLPIVYHGPREAAAAKLLLSHDAALIIDSLDPTAIRRAMKDLRLRASALAENALVLCREKFQIRETRTLFWNRVCNASLAGK